MAITPTVSNISKDESAYLVTWEALTNVETSGTAVQGYGYADRSIQVVGTFNGATVTIQGSNDGTNWVSMTDVLGNAISMTTAGLKQIVEITRYIRPSVTSAGASTDVDVLMFMKAHKRYNA